MPTIYRPTFMDANDTGLLAYVESNYDHQQLRELIWDSQELFILPIVGTALYEELKTQVRTNTLTALNQTLLFEKINPALKWRVLADGVMIFTYKFRNKGIVTQTSDNANPASKSDLDYMVTYCRERFEEYSDRLTNYLIENDASYPLYSDAGDGVDTIHPNRSQRGAGWFMPNTSIYGKYDPCCKGNNSVDL